MNTEEKTNAPEGTEEKTSPESSSENKQEGEAGSSASEGQKQDHQQEDEFKNLPFHEHPRWKQREQEWNERFEKQEQAMEKRIADAIAANKPQAPQEKNDTNDTIPIWFGGGQNTPEIRKMWNEYKAEQKREFERLEKTAEERAFSRLNESQTTQEKAVAEANKHFETSINNIEATYGKRVNRGELLKYVLDNKIIDHDTQRWDYAKGYRWMMAEKGTTVQQNQGGGKQDRKALANASVRDSGKGQDGSGKTATTSDDFKDPSKRPW